MQQFYLRASTGEAKFAVEGHELREQLDRVLHLIEHMPTRREATKPTVDPNAMALRVRAILKARRQRDQFFPDGLFGDPAWDMLLELYASELSGHRVSIGSLCLGAAVPATTALRWIRSLEQKGFAIRHPDPLDGRRVFISLSERASETMGELMKSMPLAISLM